MTKKTTDTSQIEITDAKARQLIWESITHEKLLQMTIEFLHLHGWLCAGFRPGMKRNGSWSTPLVADGEGWPDLFAVHDFGAFERKNVANEARIAIEIKTEKDKLRPAQLKWKKLFEKALILYIVIRPSTFDDLEKILG